jgi:dCMP deaminase
MDITWDDYFMGICDAVARKSHCLSRNIGCVAVKDKRIIATGYNGPVAGYPHCNTKDLSGILTCPRRLAGFKSGEGLSMCPAEHAERNVINEAAKPGHSLQGCTLYMNCEVPCAECAKAIVNSGIKEIVTAQSATYDSKGSISRYDILSECGVIMRGPNYDFR